MRDKVSIVFKALRMGIIVILKGQKYKLREDGQLLYECDRYIGDNHDKVWLGYPSEICSLIGLVEEATKDEIFIISANITLNKIKRVHKK